MHRNTRLYAFPIKVVGYAIHKLHNAFENRWITEAIGTSEPESTADDGHRCKIALTDTHLLNIHWSEFGVMNESQQ